MPFEQDDPMLSITDAGDFLDGLRNQMNWFLTRQRLAVDANNKAESDELQSLIVGLEPIVDWFEDILAGVKLRVSLTRDHS